VQALVSLDSLQPLQDARLIGSLLWRNLAQGLLQRSRWSRRNESAQRNQGDRELGMHSVPHFGWASP
jgi:hypothetical protein